MISRRTFLGSSLTAAAAIGAYTWQIEPHWLEMTRQPLVIHGLGADLRGATLVQVSDLHVGPRVADAYVLDTFTRIAALSPDIIAYTGDFTSYHDEVLTHAARIYAQAPHGRRATIGVLGKPSGDRRMYISRGVGHLLQVRFNVRPEVAVFELQAT